MVKVLVLLLFLLTLTGVCSRQPKHVCVKAGEIVALQCICKGGYNQNGAQVIWTRHTPQEMNLTNSLSAAEQRRMGVLVHGTSFVIFNASVNDQGNYSCSLGNSCCKLWLITVHTTQSREYEEETTYRKTCYIPESCTLTCPDENIPSVDTPNITSNGTIWRKEGESLPQASYFQHVKESDRGVYTCTWTYLYHGQIYNRSFTRHLIVKPKQRPEKSAVITAPHMGDVIYIDLGSPKVIDCEADIYSSGNEVFWLSGESIVDKNNSLPVFYNYSRGNETEHLKMTASLVFKKVSKEDLSKNYTCILENDNGQRSSFVTITLAQRPCPSYRSLVIGVICAVVVMALTVVIYVHFKINITLFLRDTLGCNRRTSDGKSYDAFLMCYESDTNAGLKDYDIKWLMRGLEDRFGYNLCLYDRDVSPGEAVANAVLDCIEQSRTVVLVPASQDTCPGSGLLSAIHEALVERQTRLVFIKTEEREVSRSDSLLEALQLLVEAGECVTWKGERSKRPSSSFWKQLRYHLPAPQCESKTRRLPQII